VIVTAEMCGHRDGFWPGEKDEQSRAYAERATGDWLWQVDVDEFYHPTDIERVMISCNSILIRAASVFRRTIFGVVSITLPMVVCSGIGSTRANRGAGIGASSAGGQGIATIAIARRPLLTNGAER